MFTANKNHFSIHTLFFDIIEEMKEILPKAEFGKGCIKIKYKNIESKDELKKMCDKVIERFGKKRGSPTVHGGRFVTVFTSLNKRYTLRRLFGGSGFEKH